MCGHVSGLREQRPVYDWPARHNVSGVHAQMCGLQVLRPQNGICRTHRMDHLPHVLVHALAQLGDDTRKPDRLGGIARPTLAIVSSTRTAPAALHPARRQMFPVGDPYVFKVPNANGPLSFRRLSRSSMDSANHWLKRPRPYLRGRARRVSVPHSTTINRSISPFSRHTACEQTGPHEDRGRPAQQRVRDVVVLHLPTTGRRDLESAEQDRLWGYGFAPIGCGRPKRPRGIVQDAIGSKTGLTGRSAPGRAGVACGPRRSQHLGRAGRHPR